MNQLHKILTAALLLTASVLCVATTLSVVTLEKHFSDTLMKLDDEIDEMHRLTLEAGLTAMEARKASKKESEYLDTWNAQVTSTLTTANGVLSATEKTITQLNSVSTAAVGTLQQTQQTVASLQVPIQSANQTLMAATVATEHLDALISNPQVTDTITHVDATTAHLDATSKDVQAEVHSLTHPTWAHKMWGWALDVGHLFNPL